MHMQEVEEDGEDEEDKEDEEDGEDVEDSEGKRNDKGNRKRETSPGLALKEGKWNVRRAR